MTLIIEASRSTSQRDAERIAEAFREFDQKVYPGTFPPAEDVYTVERVEDGWVVMVLDEVLDCE